MGRKQQTPKDFRPRPAARPFQKPPRTKTDEELVITVSRATEDGISADELTEVAEWHDNEIALITNKKKRGDAERHRRIAKQLRYVASQLRLGETIAA